MFESEVFATLLNVFANAWVEVKVAMLVYGIGMSVEFFLPAEHNQPAKNIIFNLVYTIIFVFATAVLVRSTDWIIAPVVAWAGGPLLQFSFGDSLLWELLYTLTFFAIFDFFYYWFHRFQHSWDVLWSQHKFHHSEESLNITTANRHHWLEDWLRIFLILIPMQWLIQLRPGAIGMIWSTFLLWGYFIHMNLRIDLGPLTPVLAGPQLHRIHHSRLKQHQDKNYAAFFPLFDVLFGSYWRPRKGEFPPTGLLSGQNMNTLKSANFEPFMNWKELLFPHRSKRQT